MSKETNVESAKLTDLVFDSLNANKGSEQGKKMHKTSMKKFGAGRSILIDKDNNIIAGNKTAEQFAGSGGKKILIVDTDPDTLVAVRRKDVLLDSAKGREMAIADNAVAKANIVFDVDVIEVLAETVPVQDWGIQLMSDQSGMADTMDEEDNDFITPVSKPNSQNAPRPDYEQVAFPTSIMVTKTTKQIWEQYRKSIKQPNESAAFETLLKQALQI